MPDHKPQHVYLQTTVLYLAVILVSLQSIRDTLKERGSVGGPASIAS